MLIQRMDQRKEQGGCNGCADVAQKRVAGQTGGTAAEFVGDDGSSCGGRCNHADKRTFGSENIEWSERQVNQYGAANLYQQQPEMNGSEMKITKGNLAEGQQEHRKNKPWCEKRQMYENRIADCTGQHG